MSGACQTRYLAHKNKGTEIPELIVLLPFLLIVVFAVYVQTVTGFGLAMIILGLASGLGVASVAALASVISIVSVVNSAVALRGNLHHIHWGKTLAMLAGVLPASIVGVLLLRYLSAEASDLVQLLLAAVIIYGGLSLAWRPEPLKTVSSPMSFGWYGFLGGLFGGLFAIPGPPLIYQLYRQPLDLAPIRAILIFLNAVIAVSRTLFEGLQGALDVSIWVLSAVCLPAVALATMAGRRYPPPFSPHVMRRIAFLLLLLMGVSLMVPVLLRYLAGWLIQY